MNLALRRLVLDVPALAPGDRRHTWFFDRAIPALRDAHPVLERHLKAGATQFLRLAHLDAVLKRRLYVGTAALAAVIVVVFWLTWDRSVEVSIRWIGLAVVLAIASWLGRKYLGTYSWTVQLTDPLGALQSQARRWVAVAGTWWLAKKIVPPLTKRYLDAGRLDVLERE